MTFPELVEAQWSDYPERHRNKANLLVHAFGVALVWWCAVQAIGGLFLLLLGVPGAFGMLFWAVVLAGASVFVQHRGDMMEAKPPAPLALDKATLLRAVAEQFINFPRFVVSGEFLKNLKQAS